MFQTNTVPVSNHGNSQDCATFAPAKRSTGNEVMCHTRVYLWTDVSAWHYRHEPKELSQLLQIEKEI